MESGAGAAASFSDSAYAEAGAQLTDRSGAFSASLVTKVTVPTPEAEKMWAIACFCLSYFQRKTLSCSSSYKRRRRPSSRWTASHVRSVAGRPSTPCRRRPTSRDTDAVVARRRRPMNSAASSLGR